MSIHYNTINFNCTGAVGLSALTSISLLCVLSKQQKQSELTDMQRNDITLLTVVISHKSEFACTGYTQSVLAC